jgi:hypothetical protein
MSCFQSSARPLIRGWFGRFFFLPLCFAFCLASVFAVPRVCLPVPSSLSVLPSCVCLSVCSAGVAPSFLRPSACLCKCNEGKPDGGCSERMGLRTGVLCSDCSPCAAVAAVTVHSCDHPLHRVLSAALRALAPQQSGLASWRDAMERNGFS